MFAKRYPSSGVSMPHRQGRRPVAPRTGAQWFLIGDNYSLNPMPRFPRFFIFFGCLVVASLLSVFGTMHLAERYAMGRIEYASLQHRLLQLNFRLDTLRDSRDMLITKAAVSRHRATPAVQAQAVPAPMPAPPSRTAEAPKKAVMPLPASPDLALDVKDFALSHDRINRTLTVTYKLINKGGQSIPVEGRAYVVLGTPPDSVADVHRNRRRGNRLTSGSPFSIRRFKEIAFSVEDDILENKFQSASIIVFTGNGRVLLEKRYDVDITSS